jgi:hypothetical protein
MSFSLPHRPCCIKRGRCVCVNGAPPSVYIAMPFGYVENVDESALSAPDVIKAKNAREIEIRPSKPEASAPVASPAPDERPRSRRRSG